MHGSRSSLFSQLILMNGRFKSITGLHFGGSYYYCWEKNQSTCITLCMHGTNHLKALRHG